MLKKLIKQALVASWLAVTPVWLSLLLYNGWNQPIDRVIEKHFPNYGISNGDWIVFYLVIIGTYFCCLGVCYFALRQFQLNWTTYGLFSSLAFIAWCFALTTCFDVASSSAFAISALAAVVLFLVFVACEETASGA